MKSHIETERQELLAKEWAIFAFSINRMVSFYGGVLAVILFVLILIFGYVWFDDYVYGIANLIVVLLFVVTLAIGILLSIFKSSRGFGALSILVSSTFLLGTLWLWALVLAKVFAGTGWMILGVIFGGFGVIPVALIAVLIHAEWLIALQIILMAVFVYALRYGSVFLCMYADEYKRLNITIESILARDVKHFLSEYERLNKPLAELNQMIKTPPLIRDIDLLPVRKNLVDRVFAQLNDKSINLEIKLENFGYQDKARQINEVATRIIDAEVFLDSFKEIEPEDKADVVYINATFKDGDEIIASENERYFDLYMKY